MNGSLLAGGAGLVALVALSARFFVGGFDVADVTNGRTGATGAVVASNVDVREARRGEPPMRLSAKRVVFRANGDARADGGVRMTTVAGGGTAVFSAPMAGWEMGAGRLDLPEGASVALSSGWSGSTGSSVLLCSEGLLDADGFVAIEGPGLSVAGTGATWRWRDGVAEVGGRVKARLSPVAFKGGRG